MVRHAIAQDRLLSMEQGQSDAVRPLTAEGRAKMALAAQGVQCIQEDIDIILTSPLLRATETAEILAQHYPASSMSELETLSPEYSTRELIHSLNKQKEKTIAIVGHEPGLSMLIATLLCGSDDGAIELKKGGVARLRFTGEIAPGEGTLQWLLKPKQLRLLGNNS